MAKLGLRLELTHEQNLHLTHEQKLAYKHLLNIYQTLRTPVPDNALRGLDGLIEADTILKQNNSTGILIGGLAEEIWSQKRTKEQLEKHKDVDVLILDNNFQPEDFEGGIDWWVRRNARIQTSSSNVKTDTTETWYENAAGVVLTYLVNSHYQYRKGLYLPSDSLVIDTRLLECETRIDYNTMEGDFDTEAFEKLENQIRKKVKTRVPKFIREIFKDQILSETYNNDYEQTSGLVLHDLKLETLRAIIKYKAQQI